MFVSHQHPDHQVCSLLDNIDMDTMPSTYIYVCMYVSMYIYITGHHRHRY